MEIEGHTEVANGEVVVEVYQNTVEIEKVSFKSCGSLLDCLHYNKHWRISCLQNLCT